MARKRIGQLGWADAAVSASRKGGGSKLSEIGRLLDWQPFETLLDVIHNARRGEAAYPPLTMFKILLLQRWYGLSDPGMEEALADRLSFRAFAGLSLEDETPDHSTIWRFREQLHKRGLTERLLEELARQLDGRGLLIKEGTLIDASLIQSAARRPRKTEEKVSPTDPDARFGTNNERGRYQFGYKLHVAMDKGSALIRGLAVTPANIQEITLAPALVQGDEKMVYADRGYDSRRFRAHLAARGLGDGIMRRGSSTQPLSPREVERNHKLAVPRRQVEKLFGTLKRSYGLARLPYFTLARNHLALMLACFAYNLRRCHALTAS